MEELDPPLDPVENIDFHFDDINRLYRNIIYVLMPTYTCS